MELEIKADAVVSWTEIHDLHLTWGDLLIFLLAKVRLTWSVFSICLWYQDTREMHSYSVYWKQNT